MRRTSRTARPVAPPPVASLLALALLAACGAPERGDDKESLIARSRKAIGDTAEAATRCAPGTDAPLTLAVADYIRNAAPKPQRFLVAVGTDSALPEAGQRALQDKGPMYLFPGSPALQAQARQLLHDKGDYTTMLVVLREATRQDSAAVIRLQGHYVGGEEDGRSAAPRRYQATCSADGWKLARRAPEQSA
ncbi:hypothetical protein [Roseisolibacter sp. H3M3-2]|uniref:hypothetical protein n=1 Tax=Roseisolibacter sp. H3M3-2 TaxID=3031323 RepID=UPI0023DA8810|nr:hypothetical protein [Roseisolibacter sp. H3M3-2]MDF1502996.1 hypothetical protein [Roseisolibacter sp. H3M3-2]